MIKKKPGPADLLIMEFENSLTKEDRPPIIDHIYSRLLKEWAGDLTERDRSLLYLTKLFLEAEAQAMFTQGKNIVDLMNHSITNRWGKLKSRKWETLDDMQKQLLVYQFCSSSGVSADIRKKFDKDGKLIGGQNVYDIPDLPKFKAEIRALVLNAMLKDIRKMETEQKP
jgi:hypothetical protein